MGIKIKQIISQESLFASEDDIETIVHWLLTESFHTCIRNITEIQSTKGLNLIDIVVEITTYILKIKMTKHMKIDILIALAELEHRLALGANEKIQLASLVGSFIIAKIK